MYICTVHTGDSGEKALVTKQQNNYMQSLNNEVQQQRQSMTDLGMKFKMLHAYVNAYVNA